MTPLLVLIIIKGVISYISFMKTEVIMQRDLNGVKIRQSSSTQFYNANDLLELFLKDHNEDKRIQSFLENQSTKDFMSTIIEDILQNNRNSGYLENKDQEANNDSLTGLAVYTKRGKNGGTWMHPYLFMDFAMWLSPEFKLTCIKWLYDNLIKFRNDCGDSFKEVNEALFERKPNAAHWTYVNEANMINKLVFDTIEAGQRNQATEEQLNLLKQLQKADIKLIKDGLDYFDRIKKLEELKKFFI